MNRYSGSSIVKTGGCGCGGSTTAVPAKCSCGGGGCGSCQNQDFVRPNFFAGQLLTEEDLQSLNNYVVAKNRLHNRHLFGAGVVCGLDVTCNPCGGGTVMVNPGYALDCCGNDITVACASELDINKMVRELRRDMLGGYDCGDPCSDKKADTGAAEPGTADPAKKTPEDTVKEPEIVRHYCLYVRYCEEMSDPVSPYATDEPCGYQTCEPTRVREGFRFELRCPPKPTAPNDLLSRICQCVGDRVSAIKTLSDRKALAGYLSGIAQKSSASLDAQNAKAYVTDLTAATKNAKEAIAAAQKNATVETVDKAVEATRVLVMHRARFQLADEVTQRAVASEKTLGKALANSQVQLETVSTLSEAIKGQRRSDLERALADTVIESAVELSKVGAVTADETSGASKKARAAATEASAASETAPPAHVALAPEARARMEAWAVGAPRSARFSVAQAASLKDMREELLERLDSSPHLTDCELRQEVRKIQIPDNPQSANASGTDDYTTWETPTRQLIAAIDRYFRDCVCAAINPPCQPCDDMGVLLACLEIRDCEVLRICNLERTFVLTGPTLRYWFSLGRLGDKIEELCCPAPKSLSDLRGNAYEPDTASRMFASLFAMAAKFCAQDKDEQMALTSSINSIARQPQTALVGQPAFDQMNPLSAIAPLVTGVASQLDARLSAVDKQNAELAAEVNRMKAVAEKNEERFLKLEGGK